MEKKTVIGGRRRQKTIATAQIGSGTKEIAGSIGTHRCEGENVGH